MARFVARVLQRYWRLSRGLVIDVRAALMLADGRVLLVRGEGGGWCLPVASVEWGETVGAAAERLAAALPVAMAYRRGRGPARLFAIYRAPPRAVADHVALVVVPVDTGRGAGDGAAEHDGWYVAHAADPPPGTDPATSARLAELAGRSAPAQHW